MNWLNKEMGSQINNIKSIIDDRYDDELFDVYEDLRIDYIEDNIDHNIGEIKRRLNEKDYYTIISDLGLSNSDIEFGYGSEILSNMVNNDEIYSLTRDNDIVWEKHVKGRVYNSSKGFRKTKDINSEIEYIECTRCGYMMYYYGEYECTCCGFKGFECKSRSKGEIEIKKMLEGFNLEFNEEVVELSNYRYDFVCFINNKKYYLEINGLQHYKPVDYFGGIEAFNKLKINDAIKKKHANENGIYVELDYREHDVDLLKDRFLKNFIEKYNILGGK